MLRQHLNSGFAVNCSKFAVSRGFIESGRRYAEGVPRRVHTAFQEADFSQNTEVRGSGINCCDENGVPRTDSEVPISGHVSLVTYRA